MIKMNFCNIFSYKDSYQETVTRDRRFNNCVFLVDFHHYKKGDWVEVIDVDYNDYDLYIFDNYNEGKFKIYSPKWFPSGL